MDGHELFLLLLFIVFELLALFFCCLLFGNLNLLPVFVVRFECLLKLGLLLCLDNPKFFVDSASELFLVLFEQLLLLAANITCLAQTSLALLHVAMALFHLSLLVYSLDMSEAAPVRRDGPLAVGTH